MPGSSSPRPQSKTLSERGPAPHGRRNLLKGAGLTFALPCLESSQTSAADETRPTDPPAAAKRLVCIGSFLGLHRPAFYPQQTGKDYAPSPLLTNLASNRDNFTVFSGFDHEAANGHKNWDNYLCGKTIGDVSLDQVAAKKIGANTRFDSIQLCAGDIPPQRMIFSDAGVPLPMVNRPSVLYHKLFASAGSRARSEYLLRTGRSALDLVTEDAKRLQKRVSHADRQKLSEYFTSLRDLEDRMSRQLNHLATSDVQVDYELPTYDPIAPTLMLECEQIMFDLMALALQTDSTRVATLFIAGLGQVFTLDGKTMRAGYHALSHHGNDPDLIRDLIRVETEHMRCLNRFLNQLKEKTDAEGRPLLDTTIVMFGTGMGDASRHSNRDLPTLVAGGGFQHGKHINNTGKSHLLGDVFISLLRQLGIETDSFSNATRGMDQWA
ncbi:MAG: DUF1552 domain-containing protein [Rubripirellula sp.]|jgi:hypothetical protein